MEATLRRLEATEHRKRKIAERSTPRGDIIAVRCPEDESDFTFYVAIEMEPDGAEPTLRVQWLDTTTHDPQAPGSKYYPHEYDTIDRDTVICTIRRPGPKGWQGVQFFELSAQEWRRVEAEMAELEPLEEGKGPSPLPRSSSTASEGASDDDEAASFLSPREGEGPNKRARLAPPLSSSSVHGPAPGEARKLIAPTPTNPLTSPPMSPPRSQGPPAPAARSPFLKGAQGMFAKAPASPADLLRASPARPAANGVWAPASSRSPAVSKSVGAGVSVD